jgi:hypothetical protein
MRRKLVAAFASSNPTYESSAAKSVSMSADKGFIAHVNRVGICGAGSLGSPRQKQVTWAAACERSNSLRRLCNPPFIAWRRVKKFLYEAQMVREIVAVDELVRREKPHAGAVAQRAGEEFFALLMGARRLDRQDRRHLFRIEVVAGEP